MLPPSCPCSCYTRCLCSCKKDSSHRQRLKVAGYCYSSTEVVNRGFYCLERNPKIGQSYCSVWNLGSNIDPMMDHGPMLVQCRHRPGDHLGMRSAFRFGKRMFYYRELSQTCPSESKGRRRLIENVLFATSSPGKTQSITRRELVCSLSRPVQSSSSSLFGNPLNLPRARTFAHHRNDVVTVTIAKKRAKQKKTKEARTPEETAAMLKKAELIHNKLKELYPVAPQASSNRATRSNCCAPPSSPRNASTRP